MIVHDHNNVPELLERFKKLERFKLEIGIMQKDKGGEIYPDTEVTVLRIADIHEFGRPGSGIPERSFVRATFDSKEEYLSNYGADLVEKFIHGDITYEAMGNTLGEYIVGQIQETITRMTTPPLKPATIKAKKGKTGVLIDSGKLRAAVTHRMVE